MSSGKEWISLAGPLEALPQVLDGSPDPSVSTISCRVSLDPNRQHVTNSNHTKYNAGNVSMTPQMACKGDNEHKRGQACAEAGAH